MTRRILFPGSFNPFTIGHADIVDRALRLFDEVVVAVGFNESKGNNEEIEARLNSIRQHYKEESRVKVVSYSCLTTTLAQQLQVSALLRSVRSIKDYEYELQMADVNRHLTGIDTIVLFARPELASLSSSVVRELQHFGHDISEFLPQTKR